ncbi:MAG: 4a-hydroxytetrahydrobiopterin dehydratase [Beggiatoa sp. IS2]|nr:MAG: 4a-hydroxytetrahydrobiopterin dehydratase [Beggiatoa sp. IS2]
MMNKLTAKQCKSCEVGVAPLTQTEAEVLLAQLDNWQLAANAEEISRVLRFKNYYETLAFVNAVAWIAHQEDHHPTLEVHYNHCTVRYNTHAVHGLSENDFICAAKVDALIRLSDK